VKLARVVGNVISTINSPALDGRTLLLCDLLDPSGRPSGGYTIAVLCGLTVDCTDHSLVPIPVAGGLEVSDIDPADWYAPEGTFPPAP